MNPVGESEELSIDLRLAKWAEEHSDLSNATTPRDFSSADRSEWEAAKHCVQQLAEYLHPQTNDSESGTPFGRFVLMRELGRGGFGVVFLAHDPALNRHVAIKIPRPECIITENSRQRFLHEARAAASLDHPNIVAVHEVGEVGPVAYIAMAYCPGQTLADGLCAQSEPLPIRSAAEMVATLADAVQHAHSRGVIHRDLKPANILIADCGLQNADLNATENSGDNANCDRGGRPALQAAIGNLQSAILKIADFGLARRLDEPGVTQTGAVIGTPQYMAPEQASGRVRDIGTHTDVYALGTILYELLSGRAPFSGTSGAILLQVQSDDPVSPRRLRKDVPRDLDTICLKCLAKEPASRYPTAGALAEDLRRWLGGEPILARHVSAVGRLVAWARRKPAAATGIAAFAALIIFGAIAAAWGVWRYTTDLQSATAIAKHHQSEAEEQRKAAIANLRAVIAKIKDLEVTRPELDDVRQNLLFGVQKEMKSILDDPARLALADETDFWLEIDVGDVDRDCHVNYTTAEVHFRRAFEIAQKLASSQNRPPEADRLVSFALSRLGDVYQIRSERAEANDCYTRMFALRRAAFADHPGRQSRADLAVSHLKLGDHLRGFLHGPNPTSLEDVDHHYRACHEHYKSLTEDFPEELEYARMYAHSWDRLSDACFERKDWHGVIALCNQAFNYRRALQSRFPGRVLVVAYENTHSQNRTAHAHIMLGEFERARTIVESALVIRRELLLKNPRSLAMQEAVPIFHQKLAAIDFGLGRYTEALAELETTFAMVRKRIESRPDKAMQLGWVIPILDRMIDIGYLIPNRHSDVEKWTRELISVRKAILADDPNDRGQLTAQMIDYRELGDFYLCKRRYDDAEQMFRTAQAIMDQPGSQPKFSQTDRDHFRARFEILARKNQVGFDPFVELVDWVLVPEFMGWQQAEFASRRDAVNLARISERLADYSNYFVAVHLAARGFAQATAMAAEPMLHQKCDERCRDLIRQLQKFTPDVNPRLRADPTFADFIPIDASANSNK